MSHAAFLALALTTLTTGQTPDGPQIANARATFGYLGPARPKGVGMLPGDEAHFAFDVKGLTFYRPPGFLLV